MVHSYACIFCLRNVWLPCCRRFECTPRAAPSSPIRVPDVVICQNKCPVHCRHSYCRAYMGKPVLLFLCDCAVEVGFVFTYNTLKLWRAAESYTYVEALLLFAMNGLVPARPGRFSGDIQPYVGTYSHDSLSSGRLVDSSTYLCYLDGPSTISRTSNAEHAQPII